MYTTPPAGLNHSPFYLPFFLPPPPPPPSPLPSPPVPSSAVFQGQLYHGEAKSKSWTPVCPGSVAMVIQQGGARDEEWQLVASKGRDKVRHWPVVLVCVQGESH